MPIRLGFEFALGIAEFAGPLFATWAGRIG